MTTKETSISHQHLFIYFDIKYGIHWRWYCKAQGISFICWTSDRSSRRQISRRTTKCRRGKKTLSLILIAFLSWRVLSQSLSRASKRMNSQKTTGADDIKKDAAQRGSFLSSVLGHSPKRNVKLSGREQRSDFHHNRTTLSKHAGFSLVLSVSVLHPDVSIYRKQVSNLSDNTPRALEIMFV